MENKLLFADAANATYTGESLIVTLADAFTPNEIIISLDDLTTQTWSTISNEDSSRDDGRTSTKDNS